MKAADHRAASGAAHQRPSKPQSQLVAFSGSVLGFQLRMVQKHTWKQKYLSFANDFVLLEFIMQDKLAGNVLWLHAECHILLDRQWRENK